MPKIKYQPSLKAADAWLRKDKIIFSVSAKASWHSTISRSCIYKYLEMPAGDPEIGRMVVWIMDNPIIYNSDAEKPSSKSPGAMGNIWEFVGEKSWYSFIAATLPLDVRFRKDGYLFSPSKRGFRRYESIEPSKDFLIPLTATVEEVGAAVRKGFALCDPKKNEFLPLLYPDGNFPPEVLKMHGSMICGGKFVDPNADGPVAFGPSTLWMAVKTREVGLLLKALDLSKAKEASWEKTIDSVRFAGGCPVFVSPAVKGWVYIILPLVQAEQLDKLQELTKKLSLQFGEAQLFASESTVDYALWAKAKKGKTVRLFKTGEEGVRAIGKPTKEEREVLAYAGEPQDQWRVAEYDVCRVAGAWGLNPLDFVPGRPSSTGPGRTGTLKL